MARTPSSVETLSPPLRAGGCAGRAGTGPASRDRPGPAGGRHRRRTRPYEAPTILVAVRRASAISDSIGFTPDAVGMAEASVT